MFIFNQPTGYLDSLKPLVLNDDEPLGLPSTAPIEVLNAQKAAESESDDAPLGLPSTAPVLNHEITTVGGGHVTAALPNMPYYGPPPHSQVPVEDDDGPLGLPSTW